MTWPRTLLFAVGAALILLGAAHVPVALAGLGEPGGFEPWRKVVLFGVATGVTCGSLAWIRGLLPPGARRAGDAACWIVAPAALLEVGLIALQPWRGERSHFNDATAFDAAVAWTIDGTAVLLTLGILVLALAATTTRPRRTDGGGVLAPDMTHAVRAGLWLLVVACGFGIHMLVHGTHQAAEDLPTGRWGEAGVLKFVHGMPLHAVQILPCVAWVLARLRVAGTRRLTALRCTSAGLVAATAYAALQTFRGRARFDTDLPGLVLLAATAGLLLVPFVVALRRT